MSRILLDENIPVGLRSLLGAHDIVTVEHQGWKGLANGRLLQAAVQARFDVLVTADQNIRFQQSGVGRSLAIIVLSTTRWRLIRNAAPKIASAIERAHAGSCQSLDMDEPA